MSPALDVIDNLTSSSDQKSTTLVADNERANSIDRPVEPDSSGVVINKIIMGGVKGDDDQQHKSPYPFTTSGAAFWTPGLPPLDDDVNYGSCNMSSSLNQDEVDQTIQQTFLNGGSDKLNQDIESLFAGQSNYHPVDRSNSKVRWWRHPKFKENWKIFFAAFGLLVVGVGLITMGVVVSVLPDIDFQSYVFFIAGTICFIPGAYHVVFLYFALSGRKGYDFHQLPLFN